MKKEARKIQPDKWQDPQIFAKLAKRLATSSQALQARTANLSDLAQDN